MKHISRSILTYRHQTKAAIRSHLDEQGFIEVDTPYLLEANTPDPFIDPVYAITHSDGDQRWQLHTSPELWLKKVIALGLPRIYEMARVFRDDPLGPNHLREFTMLEWYRKNADLNDLIHDCEMIFAIAHTVGLNLNLISAKPLPLFIRTDVASLFRDLIDLDLPAILHKIDRGHDDHLQREVQDRLGDHLPANASFSDTFFHLMVKYIEPNIPHDHPVVIARWPKQLAALAARCADNHLLCDRFEIYFRGLEIANAYQECSDPNELRARFLAENQLRTRLGKPCFPIDETFLASVSYLKMTSGIALGIDRLFQSVLNKGEISQISLG